MLCRLVNVSAATSIAIHHIPICMTDTLNARLLRYVKQTTHPHIPYFDNASYSLQAMYLTLDNKNTFETDMRRAVQHK